VPIALGVGVTQRQIDCIEQANTRMPAFNAAEQALLAFGRKSSRTCASPSRSFAAMRTHFSEQEIVEVDPGDRLLHDDGAP
jgi:alkylhydroperoxidase family enzyme